MAGQTASEIRVGANGTLYIAPAGTAGPVDITSAWTGFTNIGFADDTGVKLSRSMTTNTVQAWQSIAPLRYLITGVSLTAAFQLLQADKDIIPLYFGGGSITTQAAGKYLYNISSSPAVDERVFGVEWTDAALTYRFVMGRCMVTATGDTTIGRDDAIMWNFTISAMTPTSGSVLGYLLTNDTAAFA